MYYIATGFDWKEGTIISETTFEKAPHKTFFNSEVPSDLLSNHDFVARRETELYLEQYRMEKFSDKPSRSNALFLNRTYEDAIKWQTRGSRKNYKIYELSVCDEENSCVVNYIWYNYCVRLKKAPGAELKHIFGKTPEEDFVQSIEAYWSNRPTDYFGCSSENETLYVGTLVVS